MQTRIALSILFALLLAAPAFAQPATLRAGFSAKAITPVGTPPPGWGFIPQPVTGVWGEQYVDVNGNTCFDPGEPFIDDPANTLIDPQSSGKWDGAEAGAGFGAQCALGMLDDIWARVVVLSNGGTDVAMISLDVVGFFQEEIDRIREELAQRYPQIALQLDTLLVSSTHSHEGPDTMGLWSHYAPYAQDGKYPLWQQYIRHQVIEGIAEAWSARENAHVKFGVGTEARGLRDSRGPTVFDTDVWAAEFVRPLGGQTIGTIVNYSNHPEALAGDNSFISSDFSHGIRERMEQMRGGISVFFVGSVGGLQTPLRVKNIPGFPEGGESPERAYKLGEIVADAALSGLAGAPLVTDTSISIAHKDFVVPFENASLTALNEAGIFDKDLVIDGNGNAGVLTEMHAITVGPAVFITVPGELFPETANGGHGRDDPNDAEYCPEANTGRPIEPLIRDQFQNATYKFLFGLGGDELGYIVPKYDFWATGFPPGTEVFPPGTPVDELPNEPRPPINVGVIERDDPCGVGHYEETVSTGSTLAPLVACTAAELAGHDPFGTWDSDPEYIACSPDNTSPLPDETIPQP